VAGQHKRKRFGVGLSVLQAVSQMRSLLMPPKERLKSLARQTLSVSARRRLARYACWPPVGWARLGSLRRLSPISRYWGSERGLPIDRYYIEQFLAAHASDIRGHGLEIKEDLYTSRFGGDRITKLDILHPEEGNPNATIVADLTVADNLASNSFDFIIATQTLDFVYDVRAAVATLSRILKPGGRLLATVSGISKISREDMDRWGHYWAFTTRSTEQLLHEFFPAKNVQVEAHGNVLAAIAFLHGLATEELRREELDCDDRDFQVLISIRAVKPELAA
jgi:SAM-dependent methyltransferase